MAQIGKLRQVGIGKESSKGTGVAATYWIGVENGKVIPLVEYAEDLSNNGRIEGPIQSEVVRSDAISTFGGPVRSDFIGMLLKAALGTSNSALASGESAAWEHTFTVKNDNDHPAYSLHLKDGIAAERSVYSMLSKLHLECDARGLLMFDAEFVGRGLASTTATPAYSSDHIWKGSQASVKLATDLSGLGAASAVKFHKLSLDFDTGLVQHPAFGSLTLDENVNGALKISGELQLLHSANTYRDYVTAGTDKAMRIAFVGDAIGSAEFAELQINFAKCSFEEWDITDSNEDYQVETIRFKAQYDMDEGSPQMVQAVLTNEENTSAY